jgi:hypothetical protein
MPSPSHSSSFDCRIDIWCGVQIEPLPAMQSPCAPLHSCLVEVYTEHSIAGAAHKKVGLPLIHRITAVSVATRILAGQSFLAGHFSTEYLERRYIHLAPLFDKYRGQFLVVKRPFTEYQF